MSGLPGGQKSRSVRWRFLLLWLVGADPVAEMSGTDRVGESGGGPGAVAEEGDVVTLSARVGETGAGDVDPRRLVVRVDLFIVE